MPHQAIRGLNIDVDLRPVSCLQLTTDRCAIAFHYNLKAAAPAADLSESNFLKIRSPGPGTSFFGSGLWFCVECRYRRVRRCDLEPNRWNSMIFGKCACTKKTRAEISCRTIQEMRRKLCSGADSCKKTFLDKKSNRENKNLRNLSDSRDPPKK